MAYFTKEDLLEASDLNERDVDLPSIGGKVRVRSLPAQFSNQAISDALVTKLIGNDQVQTVDAGKMELIQVLHGLVNPRLADMKEAETFASKCGPAFKEVVRAIDELSGVDKDAIEEAEARFPRGGSDEASGNGAATTGDKPGVEAAV